MKAIKKTESSLSRKGGEKLEEVKEDVSNWRSQIVIESMPLELQRSDGIKSADRKPV